MLECKVAEGHRLRKGRAHHLCRKELEEYFVNVFGFGEHGSEKLIILNRVENNLITFILGSGKIS